MNNKTETKVRKFFSQFPQRRYRRHQILISADEEPPGVFYLENGLIREYFITSKGTELTINIFKPFSFLPMSWVIANVHNLNYYEAMTDIIIRKAPKENVREFVTRESDILQDLLRRLYFGIEGMFMHIESLMAGDAVTKVAATFLILGKRFGKQQKGQILVDLKMTEEELASYAGVSRETVSRALHKLKINGLIESISKKYIIKNIKKLEEELL